MKITITRKEARERGVWLELCELKGMNPWVPGKDSKAYTLTFDEAKKLGLVAEASPLSKN